MKRKDNTTKKITIELDSLLYEDFMNLVNKTFEGDKTMAFTFLLANSRENVISQHLMSLYEELKEDVENIKNFINKSDTTNLNNEESETGKTIQLVNGRQINVKNKKRGDKNGRD